MSLNKYKEFEKLTARIERAFADGNISHAYILEGDSCIDKRGFAREFVKAVLCTEEPGNGCDLCVTCRKIDHDNYEDLYTVCADDLSVKDAEVAALQEKLKNKPSGGSRNIAVIEDADTMTVRAQNRLLKTLEEPSEGTVIILLSENTENLLPTITSRCIIYRLGNYAAAAGSEDLAEAGEILKMITEGAYFCDIKDKLAAIVKDRKEAFRLLDGLERVYRRYLTEDEPQALRREKMISDIRYIEEARRDLLANVNYKYAVRNLILKIGG